MCGIIAALHPHRPVDPMKIAAGLAALRHRGPDGRGTWRSEDGRVALGHARLAILAPDNGDQPVASEDGRVVATVNGEFYGFEAIRAELEGQGHRFRTASDSEILVHLYEDEGLGALERLRGEFAFALWDDRTRTLTAARDRFGVKPLCWTERNGSLLLASEAKALFAMGAPAAWDRDAFFQAVSVQYTPPDRTLFAGVRQLRPGHILQWRDGVTTTRPYWDLDCPAEEAKLHDVPEADLVAEFARLLEESVRLRLRADAPLTCHLSGGIDSSAVLGLMVKAGGPVDCFSVFFDREGYDERDFAIATARHVGARLHPVTVTQEDVLDLMPAAVAAGEGFAINGHLAAKLKLNQAIHAAGFKIALTGEGADEVLAGYPHFREDLLAGAGADDRRERLHAENVRLKGVFLPSGATLSLAAVEERLGFVPTWLKAKASMGLRLHGVLRDDVLAEFATRDPYREFLSGMDVDGQMRGRHPVDQASYAWTRSCLANYILRTIGDGTEMSCSIEGRVPFLDHHLHEFAKRLPMGMKIRDGLEKHVLREAARPVLTETLYRRRKAPFMAPPLSAFADPATSSRVRDELVAGGGSGFFDVGKLVMLLDRLPSLAESERIAAEPVLMTALSARFLSSAFGL